MARKKILVLGSGMVGRVIASDLAEDFEVSIADLSEAALAAACARCPSLRVIRADLSDPREVGRLAAEHEFVAGALPSRFGFAALRAVIEAGRDYCDISFMPEDAWDLDELARERGVTAVVDCGIAPGMSNLLAGLASVELAPCESVAIYVGGLPVVRSLPFEYKAAFAPGDVLEEYTRPARLVERGRVVVKEALSEPEAVEFEGLGTLEAFNTDGLRSMTRFLDIPDMKEKTLRYPGHAALMAAFRDAGFFGREAITIPWGASPSARAGAEVRPIDLAAALLIPRWTYGPGERDFTAFRVIAKGLDRQGRPAELRWDMLHHAEPDGRTSSMARVTAAPCAAVARLLAGGELKLPGVVPPELIGAKTRLSERILADLHARGIRIVRRMGSVL